MDVRTIRDEIKVRLETVNGLRAFDTIPSVVSPPAAVVAPDEPFIEYPETIGAGMCRLRFRVVLIASQASDRAGQDLLDRYLSAGSTQEGSVITALTGDRTLNGSVETLVVRTAHDYGSTEFGGVSFWKADVALDVMARRS